MRLLTVVAPAVAVAHKTCLCATSTERFVTCQATSFLVKRLKHPQAILLVFAEQLLIRADIGHIGQAVSCFFHSYKASGSDMSL
jgi:hypothetical protein